jgi:hypothetical protein
MEMAQSRCARLSSSVDPLDELALAPNLDGTLALQLPAPVVAVLRLDPAALAGQVAAGAALRHDALELVLAHGVPYRLAILERLPERTNRVDSALTSSRLQDRWRAADPVTLRSRASCVRQEGFLECR